MFYQSTPTNPDRDDDREPLEPRQSREEARHERALALTDGREALPSTDNAEWSRLLACAGRALTFALDTDRHERAAARWADEWLGRDWSDEQRERRDEQRDRRDAEAARLRVEAAALLRDTPEAADALGARAARLMYELNAEAWRLDGSDGVRSNPHGWTWRLLAVLILECFEASEANAPAALRLLTFKKPDHRCKAAIVATANDGGCQVSVCTCGKWRRWVRRPHRFGAEGKWRDAPAPFCRGPLGRVEVVRP